MRYVKIFMLHFEQIFEYRARVFVYFLMSVINPLILILFWKGALSSGRIIKSGWNISSFSTYYLLLAIAGSLLMSHIEEDVSTLDIQKGNLIAYLIKPFSYFWKKFFEALPYQILQGMYGILVFAAFIFISKGSLVLASNYFSLIAACVIILLGLFLAFTFKMVLGISAFWLIDIKGLYELNDVLTLIFAGYITPIFLLPTVFANLSYILPFSYMIYFPVLALEGKLSNLDIIATIAIQGAWILTFYVVFQILWHKGLEKFTAVGQ